LVALKQSTNALKRSVETKRDRFERRPLTTALDFDVFQRFLKTPIR